MHLFDMPAPQVFARLAGHEGEFHEALTVLANARMCRPAGAPSQLTSYPEGVVVGDIRVRIGGLTEKSPIGCIAVEDFDHKNMTDRRGVNAELDVAAALGQLLCTMAIDGPDALKTYTGRYSGYAAKPLPGLFRPVQP